MRTPCEVVANIIMPAIRSYIVKKLMDIHGYTQLEAAESLGMTQSAISRYHRGSRGRDLEIVKPIQPMINEIVEGIVEGKISAKETIENICMICYKLRSEGIICKLHKKIVPTLDEDCNFCNEIFERFHFTNINTNI